MGAVWWYCIKNEREKRSTNSIFSLAGHENNITQPKTDVLVLHLIFQRFDCYCGFVQMSLFYISSFNVLTVIVVLCRCLCSTSHLSTFWLLLWFCADVFVLHLIFHRFDCYCGFVQMSLFYISSFNVLTVIVVLCRCLCSTSHLSTFWLLLWFCASFYAWTHVCIMC